MQINIRILFSFLLLLVLTTGHYHPSKVMAQKKNHQLWMNYALSIPISEQLSWGGDVGVRGLGSNPNWNQFLIRPTITYAFKTPLKIAGAMAWFGTYNKGENNSTEFRIHQDFDAKWPDLGIVEFSYRLRIEQRFFFYQEDIPNTFRVRVRALIGVETQDLKWFGSKRPIYFQSILEGFKTLGESEALEVFINQIRLHLAFGHRISDNFRYELHYIAQSSRLFTADGIKTTENIYRIRFFHSLITKKQ